VLQCVDLTQHCPESHATEVKLEILKSHLCNRFATPIEYRADFKESLQCRRESRARGGWRRWKGRRRRRREGRKGGRGDEVGDGRGPGNAGKISSKVRFISIFHNKFSSELTFGKELESYLQILKSQLATQFTMSKDYRAGV